LKYIKEEKIGIKQIKIDSDNLSLMIKMIDSGKISGKIAKDVFDEMYKTGVSCKKIVEEKGVEQISNSEDLVPICEKILNENEKAIQEIKEGKDRALGFLVGLVMKETKGQANPKMVNDILREKIGV